MMDAFDECQRQFPSAQKSDVNQENETVLSDTSTGVILLLLQLHSFESQKRKKMWEPISRHDGVRLITRMITVEDRDQLYLLQTHFTCSGVASPSCR